MPDNQQGKQKPTVSNDNRDAGSVTVGNPGDSNKQRGDAVRAAGNKVHGDKLEGMIPDDAALDEDDESELK